MLIQIVDPLKLYYLFLLYYVFLCLFGRRLQIASFSWVAMYKYSVRILIYEMSAHKDFLKDDLSVNTHIFFVNFSFYFVELNSFQVKCKLRTL